MGPRNKSVKSFFFYQKRSTCKGSIPLQDKIGKSAITGLKRPSRVDLSSRFTNYLTI